MVKVATTITWSGWVGVQLFFVLSGFLITGILVEQREAPRYFRNFYIRRSLRIFPLYYLTLTIAFLIVTPLFGSPEFRTSVERDSVWLWTYLYNWMAPFGHHMRALSHFWSLAVEEQFYLIWPLVVLLAVRERLARICVILVVAAFGFRAAVYWLGLPQGLAYSATLARCDALAAGALLAITARNFELHRRVQRWLAPLAFGSAFAICGITIWRRAFSEIDPVVQIVGQTLLLAPCLWLIMAAQRPPTTRPTALHRFFESNVLRSLGRYSYAMYVIHWPVHWIATERLGQWVNQGGTLERLSHQAAYVSGVFVVTTVLAIASWFMFEKRVLDMKERLAPLTSRTTYQRAPA